MGAVSSVDVSADLLKVRKNIETVEQAVDAVQQFLWFFYGVFVLCLCNGEGLSAGRCSRRGLADGVLADQANASVESGRHPCDSRCCELCREGSYG